MFNFNKKVVKPSKHRASKKNFRHQKNLSKGELNHLKFADRNNAYMLDDVALAGLLADSKKPFPWEQAEADRELLDEISTEAIDIVVQEEVNPFIEG